MNYSQPLVNWESFSNFRCFMHKILECRQRGPGKWNAQVILFVVYWLFVWELSVFVAAWFISQHALCMCLFACLPVCEGFWTTAEQACHQASGIRYLCLIPARFSSSLMFASIHALYCTVECGEVEGVRQEVCNGVSECVCVCAYLSMVGWTHFGPNHPCEDI